MPADIVNLRRARKAKARTERDSRAAENRVVHGRGKIEKAALKTEKIAAARKLDGHRREPEKS
jgi:hypothetical protein